MYPIDVCFQTATIERTCDHKTCCSCDLGRDASSFHSLTNCLVDCEQVCLVQTHAANKTCWRGCAWQEIVTTDTKNTGKTAGLQFFVCCYNVTPNFDTASLMQSSASSLGRGQTLLWLSFGRHFRHKNAFEGCLRSTMQQYILVYMYNACKNMSQENENWKLALC